MGLDLESLIEAAVERGIRRALAELRPAETPQELLPVREAAKIAHVSPDSIRRWVSEGLLNRYGSARQLRVRRDELLSVKPKPDEEKTADDVVTALLGKRKQ